LVDPEGALSGAITGENQPFFVGGAILHVLYAEADRNLAGVANFLSDPLRQSSNTECDVGTPHLGDRVHPVVASAARELLNKSENERSGVLSNHHELPGAYRDPVVAKVTGRSDAHP